MAELSDDLRASLCILYLVGYLDYCAGQPVEDTDEIPSALGPPLIEMASQCIAKSEPILAESFRESPQQTCDAVYMAGVDAARTVEALGPAPICLN